MGTNKIKSSRYRDSFRNKHTAYNESIMIPPEYRLIFHTPVSFVRLGCQALEERITLDSISASTPEATEYIQAVLKANKGSNLISSAHLSAMEYGRSYIVPSGSDRPDGSPVLQVVDGADMVHATDPYTGEVSEALRVFGHPGSWVYYTPTKTITHTVDADGRTTDTTDGPLRVFVFLCRGESDDTFGRPEGKDVFGTQDSATRTASDMSFASATLAAPQRMLIGETFTSITVDPETGDEVPGDPPRPDALYMARMLTTDNPNAKLAEFSAAQLQNFTTAINTLTKQAAATMGVPQSVYGVASDANPASGDAVKQDDQRLINRAERLTRGFEPAWVDLWTYVAELGGFEDQTITVSWVDASMPTINARSDALTKTATLEIGGKPLFSRRTALKMLGLSDDDIAQNEEDLENEAITDAISVTGNA